MFCIFFAGTKISHLLNTVKAEGADPSPTVSLTGKKTFLFLTTPLMFHLLLIWILTLFWNILVGCLTEISGTCLEQEAGKWGRLKLFNWLSRRQLVIVQHFHWQFVNYIIKDNCVRILPGLQISAFHRPEVLFVGCRHSFNCHKTRFKDSDNGSFNN